MSIIEENAELQNRIKESLADSGVLKNLKAMSGDTPNKPNDDLQVLKQQAQNAIEDVHQLLGSSQIDYGISQKLRTVLLKLQSALDKGALSRSAIANAVSEASNVISSAGAGGNNMTAQQKTEQLWNQIEADNKDIGDDFIKMQKGGVVFNQSLLDRHKELMEYLEAHPRDVAKQKELDAVDDAMLLQAKPQLEQRPDVQPSFDDVQTKSNDRHQAVDQALAKVAKQTAAINSVGDSDWDAPAKPGSSQSQTAELSMNDVEVPTVGQKTKATGKVQGI